jgi:DNA processing protein
MPPGSGPWRWSFPARDRLEAALTGMTIVVEGAASSGTVTTAGLAAGLGREVGAVPGPITSAASAGPNELIARGPADALTAMFGV